MKLLRLKFENFGPYQSEEVIDFRALRYSRLFLIHGPVGSGKTFILDGICFALYGRSSGGERDRKGLRNLSAGPEQDTAVVLDFECGRQSYRVERRYSAESDSQEEVSLSRLPEIGEPTRRDILSATTGGVASMVSKLMGLTAEQFCQVGILPQGRFRRFLLAEGEERRDILCNMFNSFRHQRFQEALGRTHQIYKEKLEQAWLERENLIAQYSQVGGDPREQVARSTEELQAVKGDCTHHQEKSVEWEKSLEEAVRYEILDRQRDMSQRELQLLSGEEANPEEALTERLKEALPLYRKWKKANQEVEELSAELHEQRVQYENMKQNSSFFEDEVRQARELEEERFSLRRNIERLELLSDDCQGVAVLSEEMERAETRLQELTEKRAELVVVVREDKAEVKFIQSELEKIEEAESKLELFKRNLKEISEQQDRARQSTLLEDAYQQAVQRQEKFEQMIEDLKEERKKIKAALSEQKDRELAEALRVLKKTLTEGEECPLCGSLEHPNPYSRRRRRSQNDDADTDALEALEAKLEMAERELIHARERRARLDGRREERDDATEAPDIDDETIRKLRQTVAAVEQKVSQKDELRRTLRAIKQELKPARVKLKKMRLLKERLNTSIDSIKSQRQAREKTVAALAKDIIPDLGNFSIATIGPRIQMEMARLSERLEELSSVSYSTERAELMAETFALQLAESRASEKERDRIQLELDEMKQTLLDKFRLEFAGWDDLDFALARMARDTSVRGDQGRVLDRETLIHTVERQLHQSQELLASMPVPDMKAEQIRQALAREREHLEQKVSRRAHLEKSLEQSAEDVTKYDSLVEEIRELENLVNRYGQLHSLAQGNEENPDFHEWYLEKVFSRVLDAANLRLEVLAPNRFCLSLYQGLDVRIMDFLAGKERSATTLSGGESFLASLALALGLGDVLQSDRDARDRVQTLFIDEGFGYLDRRALEASLDCLESLKEEGRTVGIISHVNALRDRIRAQVVVTGNDSPLPYGTERVQIFA